MSREAKKKQAVCDECMSYLHIRTTGVKFVNAPLNNFGTKKRPSDKANHTCESML